MGTVSQRDSDTTVLLEAARQGDAAARNVVFERVMAELRAVASNRLAGEGHPPTSATGLVNRAAEKLLRVGRMNFKNRAELFAVFSMEMRRILVDEARRRRPRSALDGEPPAPERSRDLLELDAVLERLGKQNERAARTAELHWFGGLSTRVIAELFECDERTVQRDVARTRDVLRS